MLPAALENDGNDNNDSEGLPPGDRGINIYVPQYSMTDDGSKIFSCFTVTTQHPAQFNYVVSELSVDLSFRKISKVCQESRDRLGAAIKIVSFSEGDASNFLESPAPSVFR